MSNPYGGGYPPYQPAPGPHAESAYGPARTPLDGVSVAALVCSVSCCAAPVGVGLGIAGLVRTRAGRRTGRWAAITGVALGSVLTLAMIAFVVFAIVVGVRTVEPASARPGQCVDVNALDMVQKADCADPHDGEIVWVGKFTDDMLERYDGQTSRFFCGSLPGLSEAYADALRASDHRVGVAVDSIDDDDPRRGDAFFCYVTRLDGKPLDGPLDSGGSSGA